MINTPPPSGHPVKDPEGLMRWLFKQWSWINSIATGSLTYWVTQIGDVTSGNKAFEGTAGTILTGTLAGGLTMTAKDGGTGNVAGGAVTVVGGTGGSGGSSGTGGALVLAGGIAGTSSSTSGAVTLRSGSGGNNTGAVTVTSGTPGAAGNTGQVNILTANATGSGTSGAIFITPGKSGSTGSPDTFINGGSCTGGTGGNIYLAGGSGVSAGTQGGNISISGGTGNGNGGGSVTLTGGTGTTAGFVKLAGKIADGGARLMLSNTAPTIASGFGTTPSITANHTGAFTVTVGSAPGSSGVLTMPAASNGWACHATNVTSNATLTVSKSAGSTTSITLTSYSRTTGLETAFNASDVIEIHAWAY